MDFRMDMDAGSWLIRRAGQEAGDQLWRPVLATPLTCLPLITDARVTQVAARTEAASHDSALPVLRNVDVDVPAALAQARVRSRVNDILVGRACAQVALQQAGARSNHVGTSPGRAPVWPDGWVGSLSHAAGIAWAATARSSDFDSLGIDVEQRLAAEAVESVQRMVLAPGEHGFADANDKGEVTWRATLLFSAKESIFKCLNPLVGEFIEFTDMELSSVDLLAGQLRFRCLRRLAPLVDQGQSIEVRFARMGDFVLTATGWPSPPECRRSQG